MLIDQINLNQLRVFESVYRNKSMTLAAKELHLTQSGMSQHIKALEDVLEVTLFDRVKQRLVPTKNATKLFVRCTENLYAIEQLLMELRGNPKELSGMVSIGMPVEFGNNVISPLLAKFCRDFDKVNLEISLDYASELNKRLLDGTIDFAFVDEFKMDSRVTKKKVFEEELFLVASQEYIHRYRPIKESKEFFSKIDYVCYQHDGPVLQTWFKKNPAFAAPNHNVRATVFDVYGVSQLIQAGLGAGVLPIHAIVRLEQKNIFLHRFKGSGKRVTNQIMIAHLTGKTWIPAAEKLYSYLVKELKA